MKKFLRRNKGPAIAAALVFLALIAGIIGTSIGLVQREMARERADKATDAEKLATQKALDAAEANKLLAQAEKLATQKALDTAEANKLLAQEETKSRKTAEDATKSAIAARNAAEDEKKQKEKQLDRAELLAYAGKLSLAADCVLGRQWGPGAAIPGRVPVEPARLGTSPSLDTL